MKKDKKILSEFKQFIARGNIMDMAVGVIIGGAFTSIVTSLNKDIISPILGIFGGVDFSNLKLVLGTSETSPVLAYGNFITAIINFLIIALIVFIMLKVISSLNSKLIKKESESENKQVTKVCPYCKSVINIEATKCPNCTSDL